MLRNMGELFAEVGHYFGGDDYRTEAESITVRFTRSTTEHGKEGYPAFGIVERTTVTVHRLPEQGN